MRARTPSFGQILKNTRCGEERAPVRRACPAARPGWLLAAKAVALATLAAVAATGGDALGDGLKPLTQPGKAVSATAARLDPTPQGGVLLTLDLSQEVETHVFPLRGPERLVVDFPEIRWSFDPKAAIGGAPAAVKARGVSGLRVGLFRMGRSRLVLDLDGPMRRGPIRFVEREGGAGRAMLLELTPVSSGGRAKTPSRAAPRRLETRAAALEIETGAIETNSIQIGSPRGASSAARRGLRGGPRHVAPDAAPAPRPRPRMTVIALDPGHGGRDPGARAAGKSEKHLVLRVAKQLRDELVKHPRVRVVMTREDDRFLELGERVEIARRAQADLLVSIHADSLPEHPEVHGASFYTLSDRASDALAARIARRENAADGLDATADANPWVRRLLVDYAQRRSVSSAHHLVEGMVKSFRSNKVPLLRSRPHREAGFRVLKSFDQPSMLIELGFMTNIRDQRRFTNPAWRETAAKAMASAILRWRDDRDAPALAGDLVMRAAAAR